MISAARVQEHNFSLFLYRINVRDPLYFLGYGIPHIYEKGSFFLPRVMWAKSSAGRGIAECLLKIHQAERPVRGMPHGSSELIGKSFIQQSDRFSPYRVAQSRTLIHTTNLYLRNTNI